MIFPTAMYQVSFLGTGFLPGLAAGECGVLVNQVWHRRYSHVSALIILL